MKKRIFAFAAVLLCIATVLCACGSPSNFDLMFDKNAEFAAEGPTLTNAAALDVKGDYAQRNGDLMLFVGRDDNDNAIYTVYDLAANAVVWTATNSDTVKHMPLLSQIDEEIYLPENVFVVVKTTKGATEAEDTVETAAYDKKGNCFWSFGGTAEDEFDVSKVYMALDLIGVDGQMFRIAEDGTVAKAFDYKPFRALPEVDHAADGFYYEFGSSALMLAGGPSFLGSYSYVNVYDSELNLVIRIDAPAYAMDGSMTVNVLNNGNLLVQHMIAEDAYATDYTLIDEEGAKCTLVTRCVDVRTKAINTIDNANYIYLYVLPRDNGAGLFGEEVDIWEMVGLNGGIENIALALSIENKRVAVTDGFGMMNNAVGVVLANDGTVVRTLDGVIENQSFIATRVSANRWLIGNKAGEIFLINERGEILSEVSNLVDDGEHTENYVLFEQKIYDWDLNVKLDLDTLDWKETEFKTADGVLFRNKDDALLMAMADGSTKTLIAAENIGTRSLYTVSYSDEDGFFIILDKSDLSNVKATFYNAAGDAIYTVEHFNRLENTYRAQGSDNVLARIGIIDAGAPKSIYTLLFAAE